MGLRSRVQAWAAHDPLSQGRREPDPRLRSSSAGTDPNAGFLGEQSQEHAGHAGPELAGYRLVRWLMNRRRG